MAPRPDTTSSWRGFTRVPCCLPKLYIAFFLKRRGWGGVSWFFLLFLRFLLSSFFFLSPLLLFFLFYGTLPPYLSSCLSVCTPSRTLRSSSNGKKLCLVQDGNLRALVTGRSLFRLFFVWNNLPAHIRHYSFFLTVQNFS